MGIKVGQRSKSSAAVGQDFPPGFRRRFDNADGRWAEIEVVDCRLRVSSGKQGAAKGQSGGGTKDTVADAQAMGAAKIREWLQDGFAEGKPVPGRQFDLHADVVATFRSVAGPKWAPYHGGPKYDYLPVSGRRSVFAEEKARSQSWLVCCDDRTRAVLARSSQAVGAKNHATHKEITEAMLDVLETRRDEILGDRTTPVRKLRLARPIGAFSHLAVLSPTTHNLTYSAADNVACHTLGRSIWRAFLCFDSELSGTETVTLGEARCTGHGCIPTAKLDREPHVVLDLRYLRRLDKPDKDRFQVYPPREFDRRLSTKALASMRAAALDLRNYQGKARRLLPGQTLSKSDIDELRAFFGIVQKSASADSA